MRMLQQCWSPLPTAAPVTFVKALHNLELQEGGTAHLSCEVSSPDVPVEWKKGSSVIQPSHKCSIQQEGRVHTLIIRDLSRADAGEYSCHTAAGKTTARLEVKGMTSSVPSSGERRGHRFLKLSTTREMLISGASAAESIKFVAGMEHLKYMNKLCCDRTRGDGFYQKGDNL